MPYTSILKIALAPILLLQGRRTKRSALRLPEAQGERSGSIPQTGCDRPLNLLFVGDSTMAGVGVAHQQLALAWRTAVEVSCRLSRSVNWQLIAKSGVKTGQALALTGRDDLLHADVLITALGGNDALAQTRPRRFIQAYKELIEALLPGGERRLTVISGLPPLHITPAVPQPLRWFVGMCARQLDRRLRRWIRTRPDIAYVSLQWAADRTKLAVDRFHPGEVLYGEWACRLAQQIAVRLQGGALYKA